MRAEILFALLNNSRIHIKALSKRLGYAYSPVYKEIISMASSGFINIEKYGRVKVLSLSEQFAGYLNLFAGLINVISIIFNNVSSFPNSTEFVLNSNIVVFEPFNYTTSELLASLNL